MSTSEPSTTPVTPDPAPAPLPATAATPKKRRRKSRIFRRCAYSTLAVAGLMAVLTQGPVAAWLAQTIIGSAASCDATVAWASLRTDGRIVLTGLSLRVPGMKGLAAEFVACDRVEADFSWRRILAGDIVPTAVRLIKPLFRVSQNAEGEISITGLDDGTSTKPSPTPTGPGPGPLANFKPTLRLPRIDAVLGAVEFGESRAVLGDPDGTRYEPLVRLVMGGWITPMPDLGLGQYEIELREGAKVDPTGTPIEGPPAENASDAGMILTGKLNLRKGEGKAALAGISLADWPAQRLPQAFRDTWAKMGIVGTITNTTFAFSREGGLESGVDVKDVSMSVPLPAAAGSTTVVHGPNQASWLSMQSVTGSIRFSQGGSISPAGSLKLALSGRVEDLPLRVNITSQGLNPDTAAFSCEVISEGFHLSRNSSLMPFLPPIVVKRLNSFSGPSAEMDARIVARRAAPSVDANANVTIQPVTVAGSVRFANGRAAFEQFPYPIVDISGLVQFDDQKIEIQSIRGRGITGASLLATGTLSPPDDPNFCDLLITVTDAPIDEFLALAMDARRVLADSLLLSLTSDHIARLRRNPDGSPPRDRPADGVAHILGHDRAADIRRSERSWRMGLYDAVFSKSRFDELVAARLIAPPNKPDPTVPTFGFGGEIAELTVTVHYAPETRRHYDTNVDVKFKNAGMVPQAFPLPILADNLHIEVREDTASFNGTNFRMLRGGVASLDGVIDITNPERTAAVPELWINVAAMPIDDLLVNALPARDKPAPGQLPGTPSTRLSPRAILSRFNATGILDCAAHIFTNDSGEPGYHINLDLLDLSAAPLLADMTAGDLSLNKLKGSLRISEREIAAIGITGRLGLLGQPEESVFSLDAVTLLPDPIRSRPLQLRTTIDATDLGAAWPVEQLASIFAPAAASDMTDLRRTYTPTGRLDVSALIESRDRSVLPGSSFPAAPTDLTDLPIDSRITLSNLANLRATLFGGRIGLEQFGGTITAFIPGIESEPKSASLNNALLELSFNELPAGEWLASGTLNLPARDGDPWRLVTPLDVSITGGRLESALTHRVILAAAGQSMLDWLKSSDIRGSFDTHMNLSVLDPAAPVQIWKPVGTISPESLGLTRRGVRVELPRVRGSVALDDTRGRFQNITAANDGWQIGLTGTFDLAAEQSTAWAVDASLYAAGLEIKPDLLALLPDPIQEAFDGAAIKIIDGFTLDRGNLKLSGAKGSDSVREVNFDGLLAFQGMSADVGVLLRRGRGELAITAVRERGAADASARLDLAFESLIAANLPLAPAGATIATGKHPGDVTLPSIFGDCAGGRLSGLALVRAQPDGRKHYQARVTLAGVRFAEMLAALKTTSESDTPAIPLAANADAGDDEPLPPPPAPPPPRAAAVIDGPSRKSPNDTSRGVLDAEIAVAGTLGDDASKSGRGSLRIAGGDILQVPLLVPLIEMSNFQLPSSERLDFLHSSFHLRGSRVVFDELAVMSSTVSLVGNGTMTLPDLRLNLTFNSQSRSRLPLVSDFIEGIRDEFVTTTVKGTLAKPDIGTTSLPGTRRLLDSMFGNPDSSASTNSRETERRAREQRERSQTLQPPR